jgi:hypothetical protein
LKGSNSPITYILLKDFSLEGTLLKGNSLRMKTDTDGKQFPDVETF